jgi:hypothetical protein
MRRVAEGVDRLPGDAHVQADQLARGVDARDQPALRDRPVEVVRLVLLAAPDQLHRHAGKLLGDRDGLARVVLAAAAAAEAAAEVVPVHLALGERQSGHLRQRASDASEFCVATQTSPRSA